MAQLVRQAKVVTKDGECQVAITLDLNININSNGSITANADIAEVKKIEEEKSPWLVPEFSSGKKISNFGKE